MNITKLQLVNFRNYSKYKFDNFSKSNIIIGNNGIGKTTVLEAIYVCSLARSFKSNFESNLIKHNENVMKLKVELQTNNKFKTLEFFLDEKGKKTKINGIIKKKISDFICQYKVIIFSPDELKVIKESPTVRRDFLNISISQINKNYVKLLNNYNILIKNKNDYLKKLYYNKNLDLLFIDILDSKIIDLGLEIYEHRKNYIEKVNKYISKIFKRFKEKDSLIVKYNSQFSIENKQKLLSLMKKNREKEIILGMTKIGIHRDDISFIHNEKNAKDFSSQGIQKLIVLSLKMSELEIFINEYYEEPILLLDDLFSELDLENQNKILKFLNKDIQVFITNTDLENIDKKIIKKSKIINLNEEVQK